MSRRRRSQSAELIKVTILPLGGEVKEVALKKGDTVKDALGAAGHEWDSNTEARVNGEVLEKDHEVIDGDNLIVSSAGKIEGGY